MLFLLTDVTTELYGRGVSVNEHVLEVFICDVLCITLSLSGGFVCSEPLVNPY